MDLAICVRNLRAKVVADVGRFAEDQGYAEVFVPDGARGGATDPAGRLTGRDAIASLAAMFATASRGRATLGVAAAPLHHPLVLPILASTLQELSGGRFSLGLGVSHAEQTARFGVPFPGQQIDFMREWILDMRSRSADGMAYGGGWPVLVAALGDRMVQLGAQEADGLVLNWLTPEHATASVQRVRDATPAGARRRIALYLRLMTTDALRDDVARYDAMANYHRHFVAQGLTDHEQVAAGTTLPRDDLGAARARLTEYEAAGVDTLCIYPMGFDQEDRRALAGLAR